jgi:hypothetical protein
VPVDGPEPAGDPAREAAFAAALADTLTRAAGDTRHVTLVAALPRPDISVPRHFAALLWRGTPLPDRAGWPRAHADALGDRARAVFAAAIAQTGLAPDRVQLIDPEQSFCDAASCDLIRDGKLLYSDGNHPSLPGTTLMLPPIVADILSR